MEPETLVSILIPLRNESRNVAGICKMLSKLHYSNIEFIFLNDDSTDDTGSLLQEHTRSLRSTTILENRSLPSGWVGKVHACHQLSLQARGEHLLFLDADIRIDPATIHHLIAMDKEKNPGLISGFPKFPVSSVLGRLIVPMQHFLIYFHLPIFLANHTKMSLASAAHGSFMFFSKPAYNHSGGHKAVASSLTEDVHLMRNVKKAGFQGLLVNNTSLAECDMYATNRDVWTGFTKNSYPGIGRSPILAAMIIVLYIIMFISPLFLALYGLYTATILFITPLIFTIAIRCWIDFKSRQRLWLSFLMPVSAACLIGVLIHSMYLSRKTGYSWKGRKYL